MAVPKRRTSKSRKGIRRSHHHISAPAMATCPNCGQIIMPHRVCPNCGQYSGRKIIEPAEA